MASAEELFRLATLAASGGETAGDQLYEELTGWFEARAPRQMGSRLRRKTSAEEIGLDAAWAVCNRIHQLPLESAKRFEGLLMVILKNHLRDVSRRWNAAMRDSGSGGMGIEQLCGHMGPATAAEQKELEKIIAAAIAKLPEEEQKVAQSYFLDEMAPREIAEHMGYTPRQVYGILRRAIRALKQILPRDHGESEP